MKKTAKGTELPLLNLRGKEYLEVKYRVVWFREEHPDWSIETEFLKLGAEFSLAKAIIKDPTGRVISMAHKFETKQGFADHMEKAETGAIGRALALCGYGTANTGDDLDEGERIVDAPVGKTHVHEYQHTVHKTDDPGSYIVAFKGKHLNKRIDEIDAYELDKDIRYWSERAKKEKVTGPVADFVKNGEAYLATLESKEGSVIDDIPIPPIFDEPWPDFGQTSTPVTNHAPRGRK